MSSFTELIFSHSEYLLCSNSFKKKKKIPRACNIIRRRDFFFLPVSDIPENWNSLLTRRSSIHPDTHLFYSTSFVKEQFILNLIPSLFLGSIRS